MDTRFTRAQIPDAEKQFSMERSNSTDTRGSNSASPVQIS